MQTIGAMNAQEVKLSRPDLRLEGRIPSVLGDLDSDRKLHPVVCMESTLPKGLSRYGTPPKGIDHGGQLDEVCSHSNEVVTTCLRFRQKW